MPPKLCFTVKEFCAAHSVSRAQFYVLLREGGAPKTMKIGRRTLVSVEAAEAWRRQMEQGRGARADSPPRIA